MFGFFLVAKLGDNKYDDIELTDEENEALQFMFRDKVMPYTNFDTSQMVLYHTDQLRLAADDQPGIPPVDGRTGKD